MQLNGVSRGWGCPALAVLVAAACGTRSPLPEAQPGVPEDGGCEADSCTKAQPCSDLDCDDGNPCTTDGCDPGLGCIHTAVTTDIDEDGYVDARLGCGHDCNDANPKIHPGAAELCNGLDDNCNGLVDEGFEYAAAAQDVSVRVSSSIHDYAAPSGLAFDGEHFLALYEGGPPGTTHVYTSLIDGAGNLVGDEERITLLAPPAHGGTIHGQQSAWTGDRFAIAWNDERDANYEVYAALLNKQQKKLQPGDVRVTDAPGSSFNPTLTWTGQELVAVWQDERDAPTRVYAQRLQPDGEAIGPNLAVSVEQDAKQVVPFVAAGPGALGIAWVALVGVDERVFFRGFDLALEPLGPPVELTLAPAHGTLPRVAWTTGHFAIVWHDEQSAPKTIWGAAVTPTGIITQPPQPLVETPGHARHAGLVSLGDRLLLTFADDRDGNLGYEVYTKMLDADLMSLGSDQRVTHAQGDSVFPIVALGGSGAGILFRDSRDGSTGVFFAPLACKQ